jgi:hypothetical protein
MALYHKCDVKNGFVFVLQFFSLISDSLGGVFGEQLLVLSEYICKILRNRVIDSNIFIFIVLGMQEAKRFDMSIQELQLFVM